MRAFLYIRVSHENQAKDGLSLEAQKERLGLYANLKGFEVAGVFVDEARSGRNTNRPAFQDMIDKLLNKEADALVVAKLDRAFRNTKAAIEYMDLFNKNNIQFHSIAESLDTASAMGKFVYTMMSALAELESDRISERIIDVNNMRRRQGKRVGAKVPYGYSVADDDTLVPNPVEQGVMARIMELRGSGDSFQDIASDLNSDGRLRRDNQPWSRHDINQLLRCAADREAKENIAKSMYV